MVLILTRRPGERVVIGEDIFDDFLASAKQRVDARLAKASGLKLE